MRRSKILETAARLVERDRHQTHGSAVSNFTAIAAGWDWWLEARQPGPLRPHDVACLMAIFKLARMAHNPRHADSAVDLCGYGALAGELGVQIAARDSERVTDRPAGSPGHSRPPRATWPSAARSGAPGA